MRVEGFNVLATFHTVPSIPSDNMRDAREPAPRGVFILPAQTEKRGERKKRDRGRKGK